MPGETTSSRHDKTGPAFPSAFLCGRDPRFEFAGTPLSSQRLGQLPGVRGRTTPAGENYDECVQQTPRRRFLDSHRQRRKSSVGHLNFLDIVHLALVLRELSRALTSFSL